MDLSIYLAFTGAEAGAMESYTGKSAWLGCHLSSYNSGITPVPSSLHRCNMLVLTDEIPADGHDPGRVAEELAAYAARLGCERILLDFQRPPSPESTQIVSAVLDMVHCPVGVSESNGRELSCPVFLSPPPLWTSLEEHHLPWKNREVWLEAGTEDACVTVTNAGSEYRLWDRTGEFPYFDETVSAAYRLEFTGEAARFYLHRGQKELKHLLYKARELGIRTAVGLYQQLAHMGLSEFS